MIKNVEFNFFDPHDVLLGIHLMNGDAHDLLTGEIVPSPCIAIGLLFVSIYIFI